MAGAEWNPPANSHGSELGSGSSSPIKPSGQSAVHVNFFFASFYSLFLLSLGHFEFSASLKG